jgi:chromosome segregation ATPase
MQPTQEPPDTLESALEKLKLAETLSKQLTQQLSSNQRSHDLEILNLKYRKNSDVRINQEAAKNGPLYTQADMDEIQERLAVIKKTIERARKDQNSEVKVLYRQVDRLERQIEEFHEENNRKVSTGRASVAVKSTPASLGDQLSNLQDDMRALGKQMRIMLKDLSTLEKRGSGCI